MKTITVNTNSREQLLDVTSEIQQVINYFPHDSGFVFCFAPHTTAAITINENADPDVKRDIIYKLNKEFPMQDGYHHAEGNSDAHLKASLIGFSEQILFENKKLVLGTWQGIYFCEFDGPRSRKLIIKVLPFAKS